MLTKEDDELTLITPMLRFRERMVGLVEANVILTWAGRFE
jgi:hypothetical protein